MKRLLLPLMMPMFCSLLLTSAVGGQPRDGKAIFESMKCTKCHHPDKKINGPALKTIIKAYETRENLLKFFQGETDPIVEPERYITMKPRRRKIQKLPDEEKKALADFFFSFKE